MPEARHPLIAHLGQVLSWNIFHPHSLGRWRTIYSRDVLVPILDKAIESECTRPVSTKTQEIGPGCTFWDWNGDIDAFWMQNVTRSPLPEVALRRFALSRRDISWLLWLLVTTPPRLRLRLTSPGNLSHNAIEFVFVFVVTSHLSLLIPGLESGLCPDGQSRHRAMPGCLAPSGGGTP